MEVNLKKSNLKNLKKVAENRSEINYEWDIIVPDSKPDIHKIVKTDAVCSVTDKEIMQDRAMISGNVNINIIYIPSESTGTVRSIDNIQSFNSVLELAGLRSDMYLNCRPEVSEIEASAINSRKIKVKCKIKLIGNAVCEEEIMYIDGIEDGEIEYLMKDISALQTVSFGENRVEIEESYELPVGRASAGEILKVFMKINDRDIRPMNGKILVKGEMAVLIIYNSINEGDDIQFAEMNIPFTEIFDEPDITENSFYDGDFSIENISCFLSPDEEGENRIINLRADINISGKGYENIRLSAVVDAYGREFNVETEESNYSFDEMINSCENRTMIKETVDFGKIDEINKVINIIAKEQVTNVSAQNNSVGIQGDIILDLLYNSLESGLPISYVTKKIPFDIKVDCPGAEKDSICEVKTEIVSLAYNILNPSQLELRITMEVKVYLRKKGKDRFLNKITVSENKEVKGKEGIVIYFCDNNEKVWDIAKKYRTTVNDIMEANDLESEEEIKKGTKLLIP